MKSRRFLGEVRVITQMNLTTMKVRGRGMGGRVGDQGLLDTGHNCSLGESKRMDSSVDSGGNYSH